MKTPRQVEIILKADTYFVRYISRNPRQWTTAGQFYAPDTSLERVKAWVRSCPNLELIDNDRD